MKKRLIAVFLLIALYFVIMVGRLAYVQLVSSGEILAKAEELWSRDIPLYAERGKILDRNGDVLVDNQLAPTLVVVPRQIEGPEQVAKRLSDIIDISEEKAHDHLTKVASVEIIHPEGRKLTDEQADEIRMLNEPGVYLAQDSKREYPYEEQLSHVLGFTGIDNQGLAGLEASYNDELSGDSGALSFFSDAKGRRLNQLSNRYQPPEDGKHLSLTIDAEIQSIVERELDIAEAKYDPDSSLAIVMDPDNAEILAMSSRPTFHPLEYQSVSPEVYNRNLPVFSTYEPGSTFKIMTLASAIEENLVDLDEDTYYDSGHVKVAGARIRCWSSGGHGSQSYLEVVQNSCNPGFVNLGQLLGEERLFTYIREFGFGTKTGIDLEGESSGILFSEEQIGPIELATSAFGQGVSVTPIQQITAVAAAINGGYLYEPYVVKGLIDPITGEEIEKREPTLKEQVISEETSKEVRRALETVVAKGTGRGAYLDGYRVGGKTGTAQKVGPDGRYLENNHIVSFMGFAPADDPEYLVYVAIDNPKNTVQFGGVVSSPIGGKILADILSKKDVPKREGGLDKEYQWPDSPKVEVPGLVGKDVDDIRNYLIDLRLDVHGEGDQIISQSPEPGVKVESGSTIRVHLGESNEN
ncbi:stage V sporulation protein D [Aquisalibacillus elongatus]|nr:stage V sporulation protein D [Aquisalibacillus elongatus]